MLVPSFEFIVAGKKYSIIPSFTIMSDIERALNSSLYSFMIKRTAGESVFNITGAEIFKILKALPCKNDFTDVELETFIFKNWIDVTSLVQDIFNCLLIPEEQERSLKKK